MISFKQNSDAESPGMGAAYATIWRWFRASVYNLIHACICVRPSRGSIVPDAHQENRPGSKSLQEITTHSERVKESSEIVGLVVIPDATENYLEGYYQSPSNPPADQFNDETFNSMKTDQESPNLWHRVPIKLNNFIEQTEALDSLSQQCTQKSQCSKLVCQGSVMRLPFHGNDPRKKQDILAHAKDFMEQYYASNRRLNEDAYLSRWECVQHEVFTTGTYQLNESELVFGAKLAWRNAARCIGRIHWKNLHIFDCRSITTTSEMFEAMCKHIEYCTNGGNIRSAITIFPQRTDGKHDFRVWNRQIIGYAGYLYEDGTIVGDPASVEFTSLCLKLGWSGPRSGIRTRFDILPLVLSANGDDPDWFDIPEELVLEVPIKHPTYEWFEDLQLKWFALPAVSFMLFDCGGLEFTAAPFSGWYMSTEIGSRNFCDVNRYNLLETIAVRMGLDTRTPITLWKDKAMIEANVAVLHSFRVAKVTIVDHHTASEYFMRHYENEMRVRKGCPADWIWIVPPISGSATPVFHQEMALYHLKPSFDDQDLAWKTHNWKRGHNQKHAYVKPTRKFRFKQIAWAIKFTLDISRPVLSRRIKITVLFASETGTSQMFAKKLGELLNHAFYSRVLCMDQYDIDDIEHETVILIITSTFGNGDPPENGKLFVHNLNAMTSTTIHRSEDSKISTPIVTSITRKHSQVEGRVSTKLLRENSCIPLRNVRFAVFALGSSAYPNFCAFGRYVDNLLNTLGGKRMLPIVEGDQIHGQEQTFRQWTTDLFAAARETYHINTDGVLEEIALSLDYDPLPESSIRLVKADSQPIAIALSERCNRNVSACRVLRRSKLTAENSGVSTILLELNDFSTTNITYKPGDHLGVFACNQHELVEGILARIQPTLDFDTPMQLQVVDKFQTLNGVGERWVPVVGFLTSSLRTLFLRFLDIATPPVPNLLKYFASIATDTNEKTKLNLLATDSEAYEVWKEWKYPTLLEVLQEFPSVKPYAPLLIHFLKPLQPRFYSISSSPLVHNDEIHLTIAVVQYKSQGGAGPIHYGVCSNYLNNISQNEPLYVFVRSAPNFHMPTNDEVPMILVGPGTGAAPFRGFWQHRYGQMRVNSGQRYGEIWFFHGCRHKVNDLYSQEKQEMLATKVLKKVFLAVSREKGKKKTYVQHLMLAEGSQIYAMLVHAGGHFYVCGDCTMAEDVYQSLKFIIGTEGQMSQEEVDFYLRSLKDQNRYHEDIFGITYRKK